MPLLPSTFRAFFRPALTVTALALATSAAQAAVTLTPDSHDFGDVEVGQTVGPVRVTLYNEPSTGSDPIPVSMNHSAGTGPGSLTSSFVTACPLLTNLMRGQSCVFDVTMEVSGTGAISRSIDFTFEGWRPMSVTFTANGVPVGTGPVAVPTMGAVGLGAMSLMLGAAGWCAARRRRQRQG